MPGPRSIKELKKPRKKKGEAQETNKTSASSSLLSMQRSCRLRSQHSDIKNPSVPLKPHDLVQFYILEALILHLDVYLLFRMAKGLEQDADGRLPRHPSI